MARLYSGRAPYETGAFPNPTKKTADPYNANPRPSIPYYRGFDTGASARKYTGASAWKVASPSVRSDIARAMATAMAKGKKSQTRTGGN